MADFAFGIDYLCVGNDNHHDNEVQECYIDYHDTPDDMKMLPPLCTRDEAKWLSKSFSSKSLNALSPQQSFSLPAAFSTPVIVGDQCSYGTFSYSPRLEYSPSVSSPLSPQTPQSKSAYNPFETAAAFPAFTYDVKFETKILGISFRADKDGIGCVVNRCLSDFSAQSVQRGSIVCAVNGKNVMGLQYTTIVGLITENAAIPPVVVSFIKPITKENTEDQDVADEIEAMAMDNLGVRYSVDIRYLIEHEGLVQENVLFSERIKKINRKGKKQQRVLIITDKAIYYLKPKKLSKSKRRIRIADIGMITLSSVGPEFAVHVPSQYDAHFVSVNKDKIMDLLKILYFKETKSNLIVMHSDVKHLNDIVLTKKLAKIESSHSKHALNQTIISMKDLFET